MYNPANLYGAFDSPPDRVVDFLRWLVGRAGLPEQPSVLDVGCGPGRLLGPLADLGWTVHGLEPDPDYRTHAQVVASQLPHVAVRAGRFETLALDQLYDLIIAVNSVFPYLLAPDERRAALVGSLAALKDGGLLVLDLPNYPWILEHYTPAEPTDAVLGNACLRLVREHRIAPAERRFTTIDRVYVIEVAGHLDLVETRTHHHMVLTAAECLDALRIVGFTAIECYRGFAARRPEPPDGARLVLVGQRPLPTSADASVRRLYPRSGNTPPSLDISPPM